MYYYNFSKCSETKQFYFGIQYISKIWLQLAHKIKFILEKEFTIKKFNPYFKKNISTLELFSRFYKKNLKNVTRRIYTKFCVKIVIKYVGQTNRALSLRIKEHKYCVKTNRSTALTVHSNISHCDKLSNAYIMYPENYSTKKIL